MSPRVPLGDLVDHDQRLYSFARSSGLPRDYFHRPRHWPTRLLWAASAALAIALGLWAAL